MFRAETQVRTSIEDGIAGLPPRIVLIKGVSTGTPVLLAILCVGGHGAVGPMFSSIVLKPMNRIVSATCPVLAAVQAANIPRHTSVVVAVSGGVDSCVLLHALTRLTSRHDLRLHVAHVHHGLRGAEADEDAAFVERLAAEYGIPYTLARVDAQGRAGRGSLSLETAAREERRASLLALLASLGGGCIVTGHTANDQAETIIMRLLRGTGVRGLGGIAPVRWPWIRPLLTLTRADVLTYANTHMLAYREDVSNRDPRFTRNRIRHDIIPRLTAIDRSAVQHIAAASTHLRQVSQYLEADGQRALDLARPCKESGRISVSTAWLNSLHPTLRGVVVRGLLCHVLGHLTDVGEGHIRAIEQAAVRGGRTRIKALPHGVEAQVEGGRLILALPTPTAARWEASLNIPGSVDVLGGQFWAEVWQVETRDLNRLRPVCGPFHALCDAASMISPLTVGPRLPGDALRPLGLGGTKKVQDLMVDRHIPRDQREVWPVVRSGGKIVWIPGLARDARAALSATTQRVVHLRFRPAFGICMLESDEF